MRAMFGEVVVDMGLVTPEQLEEALELQKRGRAKLGTVLVHLDYLKEFEVDEILKYQKSPQGEGKLFGECALELGLVKKKDLEKAFGYQKTSKAVLGDILIEMGYLNEVQRDKVIRSQMTD